MNVAQAVFYEMEREKAFLYNITQAQCQGIFTAAAGEEVECIDKHLQIALAINVQVYEGENLLNKTAIPINGESGFKLNDFTNNIIFPAMNATGLNEVVLLTKEYMSSAVNRFGLYVTLAPQLVEAVRFLHANHIAHLAIKPENVLCSDTNCTRAILVELGRAWNGQGIPSPFANEIMQQSVDFPELLGALPENRTALIKNRFEVDGTDWESVKSVDWFALGGTFFFAVVARGPSAEKFGDGPRVAEFFYTMFPMSDYPDSQRLRESITQSLLLIDGLLSADRTKRINLDINEPAALRSWKTSGRSKSLRASMLQVERETNRVEVGTACYSFIDSAPFQSEILKNLRVTSASTPEFLQTLSC